MLVPFAQLLTGCHQQIGMHCTNNSNFVVCGDKSTLCLAIKECSRAQTHQGHFTIECYTEASYQFTGKLQMESLVCFSRNKASSTGSQPKKCGNKRPCSASWKKNYQVFMLYGCLKSIRLSGVHQKSEDTFLKFEAGF